jgi:hypothetical protein
MATISSTLKGSNLKYKIKKGSANAEPFFIRIVFRYFKGMVLFTPATSSSQTPLFVGGDEPLI